MRCAWVASVKATEGGRHGGDEACGRGPRWEGRIGSAIEQQLADGDTVVSLERECRGTGCIDAEITSDEQLSQAMSTLRDRHGNRIAAVLHLAAFYAFSDQPNPLYEAVNVEGSCKRLRVLQAFGVEQFIYASTILVHRPARARAYQDPDLALDRGLYGRLRAAFAGCSTVTAAAGRRRRRCWAWHCWFWRYRLGRFLAILAGGTRWRSFDCT